MALVIKPSNYISSGFNAHKDRGTTGEDHVLNDGSCYYGAQFKYPCSNRTKVGTANLSDGAYAEFWNFTTDNGLKFSARTIHAKDFKAYDDAYPGSTGPHFHWQCCLGHHTKEWIQEHRNGPEFIPFSKIIEEDEKMSDPKNNAYQVNIDVKGVNYKRFIPESRAHHNGTKYKGNQLEITIDMETYAYTDTKFEHEDKNMKLHVGDKIIGTFIA